MKKFKVKHYYNSDSIFFATGKVWSSLAGIALVVALFLAQEINAQDLDVPYVPTDNEVVNEMLDMANVGPGDYVIDLGSGDGRIVIAAAQRGAYGHGVDIDPERIKEAKENAQKANVSDKVMFLKENIFNTDFSRANVITMYLLSSVNMRLRPKLLDRLEPGTKLVSHDFDMGDWEPDQHASVGNDDVYYWIVPADVGGEWQWRINGNKFTMNVKQTFQKIEPEITEGNSTLTIKDKVLRGDRISFTAVNSDNGTYYVYNGEVDGNMIMGKVQIRTDNNKTIENWSANLNFRTSHK
jgi:SAM-dependent methyltransferase